MEGPVSASEAGSQATQGNLRAPLRRQPFRRLAVSYLVNEVGDLLGLVALAVLVFDKTDSVMATTALFLGTKFLPALMAPVLVARAEKLHPNNSLPLIYVLEAAVFAGLAFLAVNFSLALILILAVLDGALALTGRSLTRAVVASLLGPHGELRSGNAILNVAFTGGAALGPGLAGLIIAAFSIQAALLLNAGTFLLVAALLYTTSELPQPEVEPGRIRDRLRSGFSYLARHPSLRGLITAQAVAFVFFAAVIPIEVVYAKETLEAGDSGYGILLASWGAGMVLGSFAFAALRRQRLGVLLAVSTVAVGLAYLGLAAAPSLLLACAASVLGGTGNGIQWVSVISAVQELTRESMQARVLSVLESAGAAMPGLGFLAGGLIASAFAPRATFLFAGLGVLAVVAIAIPLLRMTWTREGYGTKPRTESP